MVKPDRLFTLIHSLTKSEKRYFKLTISSIHKGEKNHLKLFNAIEKQKEFNDDHLKQELHGENLIKRLPSEKAYLYKLVLKSLRNFHSGISIDTELYDTIRDIEILCNKMQLEPAAHLTQKAYNKALESEKFSLALILLEYERKIQLITSERQETISEENKKLTLIINNINEYNQITIELIKTIFSFGGSINTKEQEKKFRDFYAKNTLLKNRDVFYSFTSTCKHYMLNSACYFYLHELEKSHYYAIELYRQFKQQPAKIKILADLFKRNLINSIHLSYLLRNFSEARELLKELEAMQPDSQNFNEHKIFTMGLGLSIAILSGNTEEGQKLIAKCEKVFVDTTNQEQYSSNHYLLAYKIAYFHFSKGGHRSALKWLNIILNKKEAVLDGIICRAHILFLITQYELHNLDLLDSFLISTSKLIRKKNMFTSAENTLFIFLKKATRLSAKELLPVLKSSKKQFEKICIEPFQRKTVDYFDYVAWAEAKISNKTMAEIMKNK